VYSHNDVCFAPNSGVRADIPGPPLWAESVAKLFSWERDNFLTAAEAFDVSGRGGPRKPRAVRSAVLLFVFRRCL